MTAKIKVLSDSIIITETYIKKPVYVDSIIYLKIFKKGEYKEQESYRIKNGKVIASNKF
jgi:hypothetical protein